tara:strand:+ start:277 stop:663 length:387 start_codon:yes stop_codon:yes gene_type:complete
MNYKYNEIKEYFNDYIKENDSALNDNDFIDELHHHVFNSDYYIIGTYKATQWLGNETFNIINFIKEYENDNFGEVYTDFSNPENIVNMYVYIIGESIVSEYKDSDLYIQAKIEIQDSTSNAKELLNNL